MTECEEIAATMLKAYRHWIDFPGSKGNSMTAAREYVRQQQILQGMVWTDNVAYALFRAAA
jgi:hypothetical protein